MKKTRQTRVAQAMEAALYTRPAAEKLKGSTAERYAISAKGVEVYIRHELYASMDPADCRCRTAGRADIILYMDGHRYTAEIKTGGTVGAPQLDGSWTEADILPGKPYIVFPVIDACETYNDVLDNTAIMPRELFLELCEAASRKGLQGTFHTTGHPAVIAFQPTPLNKLRRAVETLLDNGEVMSAWDYLAQREAARTAEELKRI